jgi:hypothetical protein
MINPQLFRLILRQAKKKKLGHVLCLGRQRIDISQQRFIDSCVAESVATPSDLPNQIDDIFLFNFLGARSLQSMDVNSNEGAEIIHNLNLPVKKSLHGRFDTIVDGGTFDHLFDLKTAFANINKLLKVLHKLVDAGNSILVIEHNLDVLKTADYIIDIGPCGGEKGGYIVAEGTPEEVSKNKKSVTGKYLAKILK